MLLWALENEGFTDAPGVYSIARKGHETKAKKANGDYFSHKIPRQYNQYKPIQNIACSTNVVLCLIPTTLWKEFKLILWVTKMFVVDGMYFDQTKGAKW